MIHAASALVVTSLLTLASWTTVRAAPGSETEPATDPAAYVGDGACAACHRDVADAFAATAHGRAPGWADTRGCESCHGPALDHVRAGGQGGIAKLAELTSQEASKSCVTCHAGSSLALESHHDFNEVACTSCHAAHVTSEHLLRQPEVELCSSCHAAAAAQFELPRHHPLPKTGRGCTGCHPAHGTRLAEPTSTADLCGGCHADTRGPFIYPHDIGMLDGCTACHEPHGSTNRHLLKFERQVDLCYSCHPGASTPSFHSFGRFTGEKCTACHTAIHGSNTSPYFLEE